MDGYRTRIVIPPDRTVVVQLPSDLPDGPATLIIRFEPPDAPAAAAPGGGHGHGPAARPAWSDEPDHAPPALEGLDIDWFD